MSNKHTPGPWYPVNYGGFINLQSEDMYGQNTNLLDQEYNENAEANSRLAAAAPEMFAMLNEIYERDGKVNQEMYKRLYQIIKPLR